MEVVVETDIPELELIERDEVRDIYALSRDKHLIVYTDRISIGGCRLDKPISLRGVVLHQISLYWMQKFSHMAKHTLVADQFKKFPPVLQPYEKILTGRSMIVQVLKKMPLNFQVIGNVSGKNWEAYKETGRVKGRLLPKGLKESDRLANPMLLVTTEELSMPENEDMIKWAQRMYGPQRFKTLEDICLSVFGVARNYAAARGIIIAESSFEFALFDGNPFFIGQVMTPETTLFWSQDDFVPGQVQPDFEKQAIYEWLAGEGWSDGMALPSMPKEVVDDVMRRERQIFNVMTGKVAKPV